MSALSRPTPSGASARRERALRGPPAAFAGTLWVLFCLGTTGCGSTPLTLDQSPRSFTPRDYERVYAAWTREADEFSFVSMRDVLDVTATFESWEFRWAYVIRYAEDYGLATSVRAQMLRATLADAQTHHRFFVTLAGSNWRTSDLTDPSSAWRVVMVDPAGRSTVPVAVDPVDSRRTALAGYFRTIGPLRHAYRITFPAVRADGVPTIPAGAPYVLLRFTGVHGRVDLRWVVRPGIEAAATDEMGAEAARL